MIQTRFLIRFQDNTKTKLRLIILIIRLLISEKETCIFIKLERGEKNNYMYYYVYTNLKKFN